VALAVKRDGRRVKSVINKMRAWRRRAGDQSRSGALRAKVVDSKSFDRPERDGGSAVKAHAPDFDSFSGLLPARMLHKKGVLPLFNSRECDHRSSHSGCAANFAH